MKLVGSPFFLTLSKLFCSRTFFPSVDWEFAHNVVKCFLPLSRLDSIYAARSSNIPICVCRHLLGCDKEIECQCAENIKCQFTNSHRFPFWRSTGIVFYRHLHGSTEGKSFVKEHSSCLQKLKLRLFISWPLCFFSSVGSLIAPWDTLFMENSEYLNTQYACKICFGSRFTGLGFLYGCLQR